MNQEEPTSKDSQEPAANSLDEPAEDAEDTTDIVQAVTQPTAVLRPNRGVSGSEYGESSPHVDAAPGGVVAGISPQALHLPPPPMPPEMPESQEVTRKPRRLLLVVSIFVLLAMAATAISAAIFVGSGTEQVATPGLRPVADASDSDGPGDDDQAVATQQQGSGEQSAEDASEVTPGLAKLPNDVANADALTSDLAGAAFDPAAGNDTAAVGEANKESTDAEVALDQGAGVGALAAPHEPVIEIAGAVAPSVVHIEVESTFGAGVGSGIIWDASQGYIVTNQHVVQGVEEVVVGFYDGTVTTGKVVGGSTDHDVAVVQVDTDGVDLVPAVFAPTSSVQVGQLAVAIGSPFGLDGTVTAGIISAVRIHPSGGGDPANPIAVEMIQTDASINRGNSGGALVDSSARVVGMNTFIQTTTGGSIGLGFAVPSDVIELIATRVVNGESLELGFIGIEGGDDTERGYGVLIRGVTEGTPAIEAGLEVGDVILSMDGQRVEGMLELSAYVKLKRPGEVLELEIDRNGERYIATIVLAVLE